MTVEEVLRRIVTDEPLTWSQEGLDDGCFFCGAYKRVRVVPGTAQGFEYWAVHSASCPWVLGRRLLDMPLGGLHLVEGEA